jgi:hypothetical protein
MMTTSSDSDGVQKHIQQVPYIATQWYNRMSMNENQDIIFEVVAQCRNAMESELLPAVLREHDIPHRTARGPQGEIIVLVPKDWKHEAEKTLQQATTIFFNETETPNAFVDTRSPQGASAAATRSDDFEEDDEDDGRFFRHEAVFSRPRGLVNPQQTRVRSQWLAWVCAAVPGCGLGSLYAGNTQLGIMLMLLSATGVAYYLYQGSSWGLAAVAISWFVDLIWAPRQVQQHNLKARMLAREADEAEREFLKTVQKP